MDEVVIRAASPWNKGKLIGQKARSNSRKFGRYASGFKFILERGNWRCSTSVSTANCGLAIWSSSASRSEGGFGLPTASSVSPPGVSRVEFVIGEAIRITGDSISEYVALARARRHAAWLAPP
jgi:hypothetical protein